jgi:hypothetical protein
VFRAWCFTQTVPDAKDRKVVTVGVTKLLFETPEMVGQYVTAWPVLLEKLYVAHVPVCARSSGILPPTRARQHIHPNQDTLSIPPTLPLSQPYRAVVTKLTVHCPQSLTTIRPCACDHVVDKVQVGV